MGEDRRGDRGRTGAGSVLSGSLDVFRGNVETVVPAAVGGFLSQVPLVGSLFSILASGFIIDHVAGDVGFESRSVGLAERLLKLVVASLLTGVAVFVGLLGLVVPGVLVALKLSLFAPAVVVGQQGPVDALKDSWSRTTSNLGTVFGVGLLTILPQILVFTGLVLVTDIQTLVAVTRFQRPGLLAVVVLASAPFSAFGATTLAVMYRRFDA